MSAYLVSDKHLNTLAQHAPLAHGGNEKEQRQGFASLLLLTNEISLKARYGDEGGASVTYEETAEAAKRSPAEVLKLCDCFDYQACEASDYRESEGARLVESIRAVATRMLPGYENAEWSI